MAMTTNVQAQSSDQTEINMSLTVDEYIEAVPSIDWDLGETNHNAGRNKEEIYGVSSPDMDIAYANCPFSVTLNGDNPAGDGIPRFAREEVGTHANGYDVLPTLYKIYVTTNGVVEYIDGAGTMVQQAGYFPLGEDFVEAPHNGQVRMNISAFINTALATDPGASVKKTIIDPNFTWDQSADAGVYEASIVATFSAL
ncbi:MAG TPA: hypothetical protein VJ926_03365 [Patescibacteria group bacterium]|nr:hypothetical protein [Patescibacteria group bacterium]